MQERKYRNPPIVEVICEFRFQPTSEWDATVPGLVYERLKDEFPLRRPLRQVGVQVQMGAEGFSLQPQFEEGMRFLRQDERAFVQLRPHRISVHHLAPYPHWEGFKPLIEKGYRAFLDVLPESRFQRIGLRYINRIVLPDSHVELSDYFNLYPSVGPGLPRDFSAFGVYLLFPFEDGRDALQLRLGNEQPEGEEALVVLLDLDYFLAQEERVTVQNALDWVEQAHKYVVSAFEGTITDRLREQFDAEE